MAVSNNGRTTINGIPCFVVPKGGLESREYLVVFYRSESTIDQIDSIDWNNIERGEDCLLGENCQFELKNITYNNPAKAFNVTLFVSKNSLGDVTRYEAQIVELEGEKQTLTADLTDKQNQLDETDNALMELYEKMETMQTQIDNLNAAIEESKNKTEENTDTPIDNEDNTGNEEDVPAVDEPVEGGNE